MRTETMGTDAAKLDNFAELKSGNVAGVGTLGRDLVVFFHAGSAYLYPEAADHFPLLKQAVSPGGYFSSNVRKLKYRKICAFSSCLEAVTPPDIYCRGCERSISEEGGEDE